MNINVSVDGVACVNLREVVLCQDDRMCAGWFELVAEQGESAWLCATAPTVDIRASDTGQQLMLGYADGCALDLRTGLTQVRGRDLTAGLLSTTYVQTYENQNAAEMVESIAARHGLTAELSLPDIAVGRLYASATTRVIVNQFTRRQTDWDVVCAVARQCGAAVRVQGDVLLMQQPQHVPSGVVLTRGDVEACSIGWEYGSLTGGQVQVASWDSSSETLSAGSAGGAGRAVYVARPNLADTAVTALAETLRDEMAGSGVVAQIRKSFDPMLGVGAVVMLSFGNEQIDGAYRIRRLHRVFSADAGVSEEIEASRVAWNN